LYFYFLAPAVVFIALRGLVGTDTATYVGYSKDILINQEFNYSAFELDIEPGFYIVIWLASIFLQDPQAAVNFISLIVAVYVAYVFSKTKQEQLVFLMLIFPMFFFDMTMNGVRYGLSFALGYHAVKFYETKNHIIFLLLVIFSTFIQMSGIIVALILISRKAKIRQLIPFFVVAVLFVGIFEDRILYKFASYEVLVSPGELSGLFPLLIFVFLWIFSLCAQRGVGFYSFAMVLMQVAAFILARYSYAGLRFQLLLLFAYFCFTARYIKINTASRYLAILFIGLICFMGKYKHFIDDEGNPPSPFMPYHFIWSSR
jgi:hypothetical protein